MKILNPEFKSFKFLPLVLLVLILACKRDTSNLMQNVNFYGGIDLYNQLTLQEKKLLGKWHFSHEIFKLTNGNDSISTTSLISYGSLNETDTLQFFSTKFVGSTQFCPYVAPDSLSESVKALHAFTGYINNCFPDHVSGWFIRDNILVNYSGSYGPTNPIIMNYLPIVQLNNDSLVFQYDDHYGFPVSYTSRTPVFKKN